jgi:hypothetical protein
MTTICNSFSVSDVVPATEPLPEAPYYEAVAAFLGGRVESCSCYHGTLVEGLRSHPLIGALHLGFASHRPVCLSPDIIWLTMAQGFAHHVNANAEVLRRRLVKHDGKVVLIVRRDEFVKGSPENDWPGTFAEFSAGIEAHVGAAQCLIVADFSTTRAAERAASEVVLLDTMQAFFSYELRTKCGIPAITLEGTVDDWREIRRRVNEFERFDLGWWVKPLRPILDQFVAAAEGRVDRQFWESIYQWGGPAGSGSPYVSGWALKLFPYLDNHEAKYARLYGERTDAAPLRPNPWLDARPAESGPGRDDFPSLPARAPFRWKYYGETYEMELIGGLLGVRQDADTLCLRPEIGWAVRDERKACPFDAAR